jgi:hypothetical protein
VPQFAEVAQVECEDRMAGFERTRRRRLVTPWNQGNARADALATDEHRRQDVERGQLSNWNTSRKFSAWQLP